jgi:hypothetical protein
MNGGAAGRPGARRRARRRASGGGRVGGADFRHRFSCRWRCATAAAPKRAAARRRRSAMPAHVSELANVRPRPSVGPAECSPRLPCHRQCGFAPPVSLTCTCVLIPCCRLAGSTAGPARGGTLLRASGASLPSSSAWRAYCFRCSFPYGGRRRDACSSAAAAQALRQARRPGAAAQLKHTPKHRIALGRCPKVLKLLLCAMLADAPPHADLLEVAAEMLEGDAARRSPRCSSRWPLTSPRRSTLARHRQTWPSPRPSPRRGRCLLGGSPACSAAPARWGPIAKRGLGLGLTRSPSPAAVRRGTPLAPRPSRSSPSAHSPAAPYPLAARAARRCSPEVAVTCGLPRAAARIACVHDARV